MTKLKLIFLCIIYCGCSEITEKQDIPSPPVWVEKSRPEDLEEKGIDAHNVNLIYPDRNSIKLMWHPNPEEDIWKYHVYRTNQMDEENKPIDFSNILTTEDDTLFYDEEVYYYFKYYYYLKAENFEGIESNASETIFYTLLKKPQAISVPDSVHFQQMQFQWIETSGGSYVPSGYIIRINNEFSESIWTCEIQPPGYFNPRTFNYSPGGIDCLEHNGISGYLDPGEYYWKVKSLLHDQASAESNWVEIDIID